MIDFNLFPWQKQARPALSRIMSGLLLGCLCSGLWFQSPALATDLPPGLLVYLKQKDPRVQVRFDGVVTYSNGETYLPVFPQDPAATQNPGKVLRTIPETAAYPDIIQFDNNLFLLRMIPTTSGRMTLPRLADYPIQLKEGLLPQDLLLPGNLFIPAELKIILGALPYNPQGVPEEPAGKTATNPTMKSTPSQKVIRVPTKVYSQTLYLSNLATQSLVALDPDRGAEQGDIVLNCVPSNITPSGDEKFLFVPCLTTDELVVVDAQANLIKTRIPVGSKPVHALYLGQHDKVLVSNRFSSFLSLVDLNTFTAGEQIPLPAPAGVLTATPDERTVYAADLGAADIYEINLETRKVQRTLKGLPAISAIWVSPTGHELWIASRTAHQVQVINLINGQPLKTIEVGKKPIAFVALGDRLYVVSANDDRIDVLDWKQQTTLPTIALELGSFPSGIVLSADRDYAYVTAAGAEAIYEVNLRAGQVMRTLPVKVRGIAITRIGGEKLVTPPVPDAPSVSKASSSASEDSQGSQSLAPLNDSFK